VASFEAEAFGLEDWAKVDVVVANCGNPNSWALLYMWATKRYMRAMQMKKKPENGPYDFFKELFPTNTSVNQCVANATKFPLPVNMLKRQLEEDVGFAGKLI
jgi:hypothetical protein